MFDRDSITSRLKASLQNEANKMEGSFAADNINAVAEELSLFYTFMMHLDAQHYVSTAEGEYLDLKAKDYGLKRKQATQARGEVVITGSDGIIIPVKTVFLSDTLGFVSQTEGVIADGQTMVSVAAQEAGAAGNLPVGSIKKLETDILGVQGVKNVAAFVGGTDEESDKQFRDRLLFKIQNPATSGNVYHYKIWASEVDGVGKVRVFPLHNGPGTVKVSILDNNSDTASEELMQKVRDHIDPLTATGAGKAPIGVQLTVSTATQKEISLSVQLTLVHEELSEQTEAALKKAIKEYFRSISYNDKISYVSYAKIGDILFDHENVEDFQKLQLNGGVSNIPIGQEEIPFLVGLEVS